MTKAQETLAVFPGTFDPITLGHVDIARRACRLFDQLIIAVGSNPEKTPWFSIDQRVEMIREALADTPNVSVDPYAGLTMDYVRRVGANVIVRGIRDTVDLREEIRIAMLNQLVGGVETVFLMTDDEHALTASSLIKQIVELGGVDRKQMSRLLPASVMKRLAKRSVAAKKPAPKNPGQ